MLYALLINGLAVLPQFAVALSCQYRAAERRYHRPILDIAVCVNASAWPSSRRSTAMVLRFLAPLGLPLFPWKIFHPYFDRFSSGYYSKLQLGS